MGPEGLSEPRIRARAPPSGQEMPRTGGSPGGSMGVGDYGLRQDEDVSEPDKHGCGRL